MEANFLRDYQCCGIKLDSLHELLQHFEENHAQQSSQITHRASSSSSQGGRRPSLTQVSNSNGFQNFQQQRQQPPTSGGQSGFNRTQLTTVQDMDGLEDMEMDDEPATPSATIVQPQQQQPQQQFNSPNMNMASINTPLASTMNAQQAFRQSAPTTPATTQPFSLFNNPTVSSVNTPALSQQSMQLSQNRTTPDSSVPGTPGEIDPNFMQNYMGGLPVPNNGQMMPDDFNLGSGIGFGLSNFNDLTIDEPAKRLFSKQGGLNQQQLQYALKSGQIPMDSEFAKRMREQQLVSGVGGPVIGFPEPEVKPFKCPVIGCEKAYKNQNGLKYHKQVIIVRLHYSRSEC
jgi:transcription factor SFP1